MAARAPDVDRTVGPGTGGAREGDVSVPRREPEVGLEPTTCCLQDSCSGQLSYSGGSSNCSGRRPNALRVGVACFAGRGRSNLVA